MLTQVSQCRLPYKHKGGGMLYITYWLVHHIILQLIREICSHIWVVMWNCRLYRLVKYALCISYRPITKHMCTLTLMPHTYQIVPVFVSFILQCKCTWPYTNVNRLAGSAYSSVLDMNSKIKPVTAETEWELVSHSDSNTYSSRHSNTEDAVMKNHILGPVIMGTHNWGPQ